MRVRTTGVAAFSAALALSVMVRAEDPWDQSGSGDDSSLQTRNYLDHRSEQVHDLEAVGGIADEDWYIVFASGSSSHGVVVDDYAGEVAAGFSLERRDTNGNLLQVANPMGWEDVAYGASYYFIRVSGTGCTTTCSAASRYRIRAFDTTYSIPRFNNSASQVTLLVLHNNDPDLVYTGTVYFFGTGGPLLGVGEHIEISGNDTVVLNTATLQGAAFAGKAGSISVTSNSPYGRLTGKAATLEPTTGFTFDTAMSPRP